MTSKHKPRLKGLDEIREQQDILFRKHGMLHDVAVRYLYGMNGTCTMDHLSCFMDECWSDSFGDKDRLEYNSDYLKWLLQDRTSRTNHDNHSLVGMKDNKIAGIFLHTPRKMLAGGRLLNLGLVTGLTIDPRLKSNGLSKLLVLKIEESAIINNKTHSSQIHGGVTWFSANQDDPFSSFNIHTRHETQFINDLGRFPVRFKVMDLDRCLQREASEQLKDVLIKFGEKSLSTEPDGTTLRHTLVRPIDSGNIDKALDFITTHTSGQKKGRWFDPDEFQYYACYQGEQSGFSSMGYVHMLNGDIHGVLIGYNINMVNGSSRDNTFFIDYLVYDEHADMARFIRDVSFQVKEAVNPFSLMALDQRLNYRYGFLPSRQVLSCFGLPFSEIFQGMDFSKEKYPMLDYK